MEEKIFNLRLPKEMYNQCQKYANLSFQSINGFILLAVDNELRKRQHNEIVLSGASGKVVEVKPGLEALEVKRGKDEKFKKKDGE